MFKLDIPGFGLIELEHLVLDFTGTLSVDGALLPGIKKKLNEVAQFLRIYVLTADTFGTASTELEGITCEIRIITARRSRSSICAYCVGFVLLPPSVVNYAFLFMLAGVARAERIHHTMKTKCVTVVFRLNRLSQHSVPWGLSYSPSYPSDCSVEQHLKDVRGRGKQRYEDSSECIAQSS